MYFERLAQPTAFEKFVQHEHRRVVAVHVAHLHHQVLAGSGVENLSILRERLAGRLVELHVLVGVDTGFGRVEQVTHPRFNQHRLQAGRGQQLFPGHPGQATIRVLLLRRAAQLAVWFDNAHHFVVGRFTINAQLAGMRVAHADLTDLDARRRGASDFRRQRTSQHRPGAGRAPNLQNIATMGHDRRHGRRARRRREKSNAADKPHSIVPRTADATRRTNRDMRKRMTQLCDVRSIARHHQYRRARVEYTVARVTLRHVAAAFQRDDH